VAHTAFGGSLNLSAASKSGKNIRKRGKDRNTPQCHCPHSELSHSSRRRVLRQEIKMSAKKTGHDLNEQLIRRLYYLAESTSKDTPAFVKLFADGGYFYDVSAGKKYYGADIGLPVDVYAAAFPDMHRELDSFYFDDNVVMVELFLNGTHDGGLATAKGTIPATGKKIHAPCCDVFHIENGKVTSFHCYLAVTIILAQLGLT
jgi:steroid delta-isomerase-like uncharacterized protein